MHPQSSEFIYQDSQVGMSLSQKLKIIKVCMQEKIYSEHINNIAKLKSVRSFKSSFNTIKVMFDLKKIVPANLNTELSATELNSIFKLVKKPDTFLVQGKSGESDIKFNNIHQSNSVGFISLFTTEKISTSLIINGYDRSKHKKRKTIQSFSKKGYISSISLLNKS